MSIIYYLASNARSTPKPSVGTLAHDVGMRSACLAWAPPGHGRHWWLFPAAGWPENGANCVAEGGGNGYVEGYVGIV